MDLADCSFSKVIIIFFFFLSWLSTDRLFWKVIIFQVHRTVYSVNSGNPHSKVLKCCQEIKKTTKKTGVMWDYSQIKYSVIYYSIIQATQGSCTKGKTTPLNKNKKLFLFFSIRVFEKYIFIILCLSFLTWPSYIPIGYVSVLLPVCLSVGVYTTSLAEVFSPFL